MFTLACADHCPLPRAILCSRYKIYRNPHMTRVPWSRGGGPAALHQPVGARPRREGRGGCARPPGRRGRENGCGEAAPRRTPPPRTFCHMPEVPRSPSGVAKGGACSPTRPGFRRTIRPGAAHPAPSLTLPRLRSEPRPCPSGGRPGEGVPPARGALPRVNPATGSAGRPAARTRASRMQPRPGYRAWIDVVAFRHWHPQGCP